MIVFIVRQLFREGRLIRDRLIDYVRVGWLPEGDPAALSRLRTRHQGRCGTRCSSAPTGFLATLRMQRAATELAYLRDAMARGLVDEAGLVREKRPAGPDPRAAGGRRHRSPRGGPPTRRSAVAGRGGAGPATRRPATPGPAGLGGNYPAPG